MAEELKMKPDTFMKGYIYAICKGRMAAATQEIPPPYAPVYFEPLQAKSSISPSHSSSCSSHLQSVFSTSLKSCLKIGHQTYLALLNSVLLFLRKEKFSKALPNLYMHKFVFNKSSYTCKELCFIQIFLLPDLLRNQLATACN